MLQNSKLKSVHIYGDLFMAKYIDGFIILVSKDKREEYKEMAKGGKDIWMKHGALEYIESRGDDLVPQEMGGQKARAFPEMVGANNDEDVWFSFIVFKSKEHRDEVNAKVMAEMDEQMKEYADMKMPFEMQRMAYGGFQAEVES